MLLGLAERETISLVSTRVVESDCADQRKIISNGDLVTVVKAVNEAAIVQAYCAVGTFL